MAVDFRFGVLGEVQVSRTLEGIEDNLEDARPAWRVLQQRFLELERRQFASHGGYSGGWTPLSPKYAAWKAKRYPGKPILRRTDEMFRSLTEGPQIAVIEPRVMRLGTAVRHAAFHQGGGPHLPRRPPVEIPDAERREWVKVLQAFIVTGNPETGTRSVS